MTTNGQNNQDVKCGKNDHIDDNYIDYEQLTASRLCHNNDLYEFIQPDELTVTEMQVDQQVKDLNPEKDFASGGS